MSARVTRKRARMDAEQAEEDGASASTSSASGHGDFQARPGNFEQDQELWFQDGSIILVAGEIAFKVYKGPLVNQSPVFSDMLSLPQPSVDVHPDCPIVQLLDSPEDMRHFLRALMPSKHPRFASAPRMSFQAVYACARLGHKYQIDHLVAESLEWLSMFYPSDVDKFSKYRDRHQLPSCAIAMVNLARLTGADQLLPVALAECCELGADVVNGFEREDGTRDHLAPEDLGRRITATRNLVEARLHAMEHTVHPAVYEGCEEGCIHDINMFRDRVLGGTIPGLCTTQFCRSYASLLTDEFPDVCKRCAEEFSEEELVQQRSIFRRLPELVGVAVDGWGKKPRSTRHDAHEG